MTIKLDSVQEVRGWLRAYGTRVDSMNDLEIVVLGARYGVEIPPHARPDAAPVVRSDAAAAPAARTEYRTDAAPLPAKRRDVRADAFLDSFQRPDETADQYHRRVGLTGGDARDAGHPTGGGKPKDPRKAAFDASWTK